MLRLPRRGAQKERLLSKILLSYSMADVLVGTTRMSSKGQIVIPLEMRERLGMKEGDHLLLMLVDGVLIIQKLPVPSKEEVAKILKSVEDAVPGGASRFGVNGERIVEVLKRRRKRRDQHL